LRGAATASCLGAAALLRAQLGLDTKPRVLSSWNYAEGPLAATGPDALESLDVGRVLLVGAGAVAASLIYWLHAFGVGGYWIVVDKDIVRFHNINRGLIFTAGHAGWPSLIPGSPW
jgi:molybdopterin/thiamine biosynthesis adenylyltransferase